MIEAAAVFAAAGSAVARATSALASSMPAIGASARAIQGSPSLPAMATQPCPGLSSPENETGATLYQVTARAADRTVEDRQLRAQREERLVLDRVVGDPGLRADPQVVRDGHGDLAEEGIERAWARAPAAGPGSRSRPEPRPMELAQAATLLKMQAMGTRSTSRSR